MTEEPKTKLFFQWESVEPDNRQYKPSKPLLKPVGLTIQVEIPLTLENVANCSEILAAQLGGGDIPLDILTAQGLAVACKKLELAMSGSTETSFPSVEKEEDWDNDTVSWDDDKKEEPESTSNMTNEELHKKPDEEELNWEEEEEDLPY